MPAGNSVPLVTSEKSFKEFLPIIKSLLFLLAAKGTQSARR